MFNISLDIKYELVDIFLEQKPFTESLISKTLDT